MIASTQPGITVRVSGPMPYDSRVVGFLGETGTVVSQDATGALIAFDDGADWFLWSELSDAVLAEARRRQEQSG